METADYVDTVSTMNMPGDEAMASVTRPHCPRCGAELELGSMGEVDHWSCPAVHGLAMTLSEAHGRLQNDEVARLWERARAAEPGPLPGPFGGVNMVRIVLPWDTDEAPEGAEDDTEDLGAVELDVDLDNQFIWFDMGELDELPEDLPDAPPSPQEEAALARITAEFSCSVDDALGARDDGELTERIYTHLSRRPGALRALDRVGRALTSY